MQNFKRRFFYWTVAALLSGVATQSLAQRGLPEEQGWSGYIGLQAVNINTDSQFSTEDDNRVTDSFNSTGSSVSANQLAPLGIVRYTQPQWRTQFYAGLPPQNLSEGEFVFEAGVRQQLPGGTILKAAYVPTPPVSGEAWADPYIINEPRRAVDEERTGFKLGVENLANYGIGIDYRYSDIEINEESSGLWLQQQGAGLGVDDIAALNRNGDFEELKLGVTFPLQRNLFLTPGLRWQSEDTDGAAVANDALRVQLTLFYNTDKHRVSANVFYEQTEHDDIHPVFDQIIDSDGYGSFVTYGYKEPFNWQNVSFDVLGLYSIEDANVTFYDRDLWLLGLGMSYTF